MFVLFSNCPEFRYNTPRHASALNAMKAQVVANEFFGCCEVEKWLENSISSSVAINVRQSWMCIAHNISNATASREVATKKSERNWKTIKFIAPLGIKLLLFIHTCIFLSCWFRNFDFMFVLLCYICMMRFIIGCLRDKKMSGA